MSKYGSGFYASVESLNLNYYSSTLIFKSYFKFITWSTILNYYYVKTGNYL